MNYLQYIGIYFILLILVARISNYLHYIKIPSTYFEFGEYHSDENYFKNINRLSFLIIFQLKSYPDLVYPIENIKKFRSSEILKIVFGSIIGVVYVFLYSLEKDPINMEYDFNNKRIIIGLLIISGILLTLEVTLFSIITRYTQAKRTNYYNTVYYKGLLMSEWFKEKKGINTYAVLPIGYTNIHLSHERSSKSITRIYLNRDKNIAELYSGNKRRLKTKYFNLKEIENTEFLDKFINGLTYVEGKVNLKSLFNDIYFSDKTSIEIKDYMINAYNKI